MRIAIVRMPARWLPKRRGVTHRYQQFRCRCECNWLPTRRNGVRCDPAIESRRTGSNPRERNQKRSDARQPRTLRLTNRKVNMRTCLLSVCKKKDSFVWDEESARSGVCPAAQQIVIDAGETHHGCIVRTFLGREALHVVVELEQHGALDRKSVV